MSSTFNESKGDVASNAVTTLLFGDNRTKKAVLRKALTAGADTSEEIKVKLEVNKNLEADKALEGLFKTLKPILGISTQFTTKRVALQTITKALTDAD